MKTILKFLAFTSLLALFIISCQKEESFEAGNSVKSDGVLQSDVTGTCTGITVGGTFKKDTTLNDTHYVDVTVIVNAAGSYTISTDTLNGYYFRATGTFSATGSQVIRLKGTGKPLNTGTNYFTVNYDSTVCEFSVTVIAGSGGSAVFTLNGSPASCTGAIVNGTYVVGVAATSANTVTINVNVTSIGTWSLSTTATNGITFSGSGTFTTAGPQTITLTASGTPAASGTFNISVTVGSTTCTFPLVCSNPPDYFPRVTNDNWSYEFNSDPNDSTLIIVIPQTYTTGGNTYNIFAWTSDVTLGFDTSGYYRRSGANYYEWIDMGSYLGFDNSFWLEYNFLQDNLSVGGTWTSVSFTGPVTPTGQPTVSVTARFKYKILQQNTTVTVKGVPYPNTIVVEEKLEIFDATTSTWVDISSQAGYSINYYSRDIGLIKQDYNDVPNSVIYPFDMRRYQVY
ncbi:MAG: hypothetical protein EPN92_13130 [Chitinophagaceae bacterium]|nr:MAG: hypothetical protein EPN92_13130 [Chitinophagaceae bacterium]